MAIADEIITGAEKAHSDLETKLGIKGLRCVFGYISKKAYITNEQVDQELQRLLLIFAGVLTAVGGGATYVLAKYWPNVVEVTFFTMVVCMFSFYFYKKRKLIAGCKKVTLNERPIYTYLDSFAINLSWSTILKICFFEILIVLGALYFIYRLLNKEHYLFVILLCIFALFLSLAFLGFVSIGITKLKKKKGDKPNKVNKLQ